MDEAETFAESDVTLTTGSGIEVASEGIELRDGAGSQIDNSGLTQSDFTRNGEMGFVVTPNVRLSGFTITTSTSNSTLSTAYLRKDSDGTLLASTSVSPGDTVTLSAELAPGTKYWVTVDNDGNGFQPGKDGIGPAQSTQDFDSPKSVFEGATESYSYRSISNIRAEVAVLSDSATVEWPIPDDLKGWDIAPLNTVENGGTVEVYTVNANTGSEIAGPLDDPGDISAAARSTNVALRVDLSRPSKSENPQVEALYRRYKV